MNYKQTVTRYYHFLKLRTLGYSLSKIGKKYGISRQAVSIRLKKGMPTKRLFPLSLFWKNKPKWLREGRDGIREQVRNRDNYICQSCGKQWKKGQRRFDIHHLNGQCGKKSRRYDKKKDMDNLITLCHKCHYGRHDFSKRLNGKWKIK